MLFSNDGIVVAMSFMAPIDVGFDDLVTDLELQVTSLPARRRSVTWAREDLVFLDSDNLRTAVLLNKPKREEPGFLVLAIGPLPGETLSHAERMDAQEQAEYLAHMLEQRVPHDLMFRRPAPAPIDAFLFETLLVELSGASSMVMEPAAKAPEAREDPEAFYAACMLDTQTSALDDLLTPEPGPVRPASDLRQTARILKEDSENLFSDDLDEAEEEKEASLPMHLSIYALGTAMALQVPVMGAALLIYTLLNEKPVARTLSRNLAELQH